MDYILLILGLVMILVGANFLTDGAASAGRRLGLSDLVVGLTIVAFGTSAPELTISLISAIGGNPSMAIGNVAGSNLFNILAIVGAVALTRPIRVEKSILTNEIPLVALSSLALLAIGMAPQLDGTPAVVSRVEGILLLLFFCIFMRYIFSQARKAPVDRIDSGIASETAAPGTTGGSAGKRKEFPWWRIVLYVIGGLAVLVKGGDIFVDSASSIASSLGVSDAVIGLTIVAAGTSLPELATSLVAAVKGNPGIAVGNVIGSNIFNIFLVLGLVATVTPLPFGGITLFDLTALIIASFLFWTVGWFFGNKTITRTEGGLLLACYIAYITYLVINA